MLVSGRVVATTSRSFSRGISHPKPKVFLDASETRASNCATGRRDPADPGIQEIYFMDGSNQAINSWRSIYFTKQTKNMALFNKDIIIIMTKFN